MDWLLRTEFWATFLTLTGLEIVLGIDNVIFHSLTIAKLPAKYQQKARMAGMSLAVLMRFVLLAGIFWFVGISKSLLVVHGLEISTRDLVLISGGLFLVIKSCLELSAITEPQKRKSRFEAQPEKATIVSCIVQIVVLDIVFSLDSVITAVGMVNDMRAIMLAIIVSVVVMMFCTNAVGKFLHEHNRVRVLAFCFIALVGAVLMAEGLDIVVPKSHIYAAGVFALLIEYGITLFRGRKQNKNLRRALASDALQNDSKFHYPKFQFGPVAAAAPVPAPAFAPGLVGVADLAPAPHVVQKSHSNCGCKNPLSYGSCIDCGDGLGFVTLNLGVVDYAPHPAGRSSS